MPPTPKKGKTPTRIERRDAEGHTVIYANSAELGISVFDIRIRFGQIKGMKNNALVVDNLTTIVMSPQHAKKLSEILTENVAKYEEMFMKLPLPADEDEGLSDLEPHEAE